MDEQPIAMVPVEHAQEIAKVFEPKGQLCVIVERIDGEQFTYWQSQNLNDFEMMELVREVALACRLARLGIRNLPSEEMDTIGMDPEAKICITYRRSEQDMTFMRKNISYMDAAIACEVVAGELHKILHGGKDGEIQKAPAEVETEALAE